jgi:ech hydrogenase subunit A
MTLILALVLVPLLTGLILLCLRAELPRRMVVVTVTAAVCVGSVALACLPAPMTLGELPVSRHAINEGMLAIEALMGLYILWVGVRSKHWLIVLLMLAQGAVMAWFEWMARGDVPAGQPLLVDKFTMVMALINGIVGGGICLYALGYMKEYHTVAHRDVPDRRPFFFSLLFVFMGAMFGLVFADDLPWLFFFWEITTLCSFLLIGYTQTPEARKNALRALVMNLSGGLTFAVAIVLIYRNPLNGTHNLGLQYLIQSGHAVALLPAALLCFAGITKAAQYPFSSWLLGAMVAPTPVSALLHSSTMVKAGVYLVLRLAPVITGTTVGLMVALVGGVTFLIGSLQAITTSEAKRVLAYSTVANLGLVVMCGGIGTSEAVWAGVMLIIFHAVAKCLLFLCVGVVEHKLHSRNIEDMSGLVLFMPKVAVMMLIGMSGMSLAPFGMLMSKWAALKAVVDVQPLLSVFIVFGSAATLFFWVKWMGKLVETVRPLDRVVKEISMDESAALYVLSLATFLACLLFPFISTSFLEPYVAGVYPLSGQVNTIMGHGNTIIMVAMMLVVMLFPLSFLSRGRGVKVVDPYLGGANIEGRPGFTASGGAVESVAMHNYYLGGVLNETGLARLAVVGSTLLLAVMIIWAIVKIL